MAQVIDFSAALNRVTTSGTPPYDGAMEARVAKLETLAEKTGERLERIENKMDQLATKEALALSRADLHKIVNEQTWKIITWMTGVSTGLVAATFFVAKFVK